MKFAAHLYKTGTLKNQPKALDRLLSPRRARPEGQLMALLDVNGVTLRYKTSSAVVTATERVSFTVDRSDRLRAARTVRLRQVDPAQGRRRLHEPERRPHEYQRSRDSTARAPTA
ncbi:hypothetical protein BRDID11002_58410 [Bradyrhizobium diazoefficiens]